MFPYQLCPCCRVAVIVQVSPLPRGTIGWSVICDCAIFSSYSLVVVAVFFVIYERVTWLTIVRNLI